MIKKIQRNRFYYLIFILITIGLGIFSRSSYIPLSLYPYLGDILYTIMFFFIFAFLFPKQAPYKIAIISIGLCFAIEISQLYQADWIKNLRNSTLGKWTLGKGFLWSDLVCYTLGGMFGVLFEKIVVDYRER